MSLAPTEREKKLSLSLSLSLSLFEKRTMSLM